MKPIETEISYQGRTLKQLRREGMVALYEVLSPGNVSYGYEVIIIKVAPAREIFGKQYPEREIYPSSSVASNDWGSIAWSYGRDWLDRASEHYDGLCVEQREGRLKAVRAPDISDLEPSEG